ncbi:hypothetical protein ACNHKD_12705 [Methylocystis sp. JAN1]|uniref:hypothetical protein n=1 Tax=Methylocystis sp. JAN1 TaxID=3397211 RepID=UPI003FA2D107
MDDEMAEEFADEVIESAPAEEERARHRLAEHAKQFVAEAPPSRAKQQRRAFH